MRRWLGGLAVLAVVGCRHPHVAFVPPHDPPPALPFLDPAKAESDLLPPPPSHPVRGLSEPVVRELAARHTPLADSLEAENAPAHKRRLSESDQLMRATRHLAALDLRNQSAGDAAERFYQLAEAEAQTAAVRAALVVLDRVRDQAAKAKAAGVRYPLDPADLDRQASQLHDQADRAETAALALNVDLRRRLGLEAGGERLWPVGDFATNPTPVDPDAAAEAALCDRPGLRMLRTVYLGLTPETLPAVRDQLHAMNPLLGTPAEAELGPVRAFAERTVRGSENELAVRRRQLWEITAESERAVADQARVAALELNARHRSLERARERQASRQAERDDAAKAKAAGMAGAELREAQAETEWLKAKAEVTAGVTGWHAARVRLLAVQGRLVP